MTTQHMLERINERITDDTAAHALLTLAIDKCHRYSRHNDSVAIIVARMASAQGRLTYGDDGRGHSNGNMFVVIVRDNRIVTAMWRRDTQPWTTSALRVDRLVGRV